MLFQNVLCYVLFLWRIIETIFGVFVTFSHKFSCGSNFLGFCGALQARSQGGLVDSEEPPSQRKVHYLVMKGPLLKK